MFIVAAITQSVDVLHFAIASMFAIPFMATCGYWMSLFVYRGFQNHQADEHNDLFPSSWPVPFRLLNTIHRQSERLEAAFVSIFINVFVVAWSAFLLLSIVAAIVLGLCGQLRA